MSSIEHSDCMAFLATLPDASVDSCVTDPPYELGFMGNKWDKTGIANKMEMWAEVLRVLKPGAHLMAFAAPRTYHRMACAIEDAGFEVRDQMGFMYGTGFPKSLNLDNLRGDKTCGCAIPYSHGQANDYPSNPEADLHSVREAIPPSAMPRGEGEDSKLLPALQRGATGKGVGGARTQGNGSKEDVYADDGSGKPGVEGRGDDLQEEGQLFQHSVSQGSLASSADGARGRLRNGAQAGNGSVVRIPADESGVRASSGPQPAEQSAEQPGTLAGQPESQTGGAWPICGRCGKPVLPKGLGTALKPAWEPICLARKPLAGTVAENVLQHGCGALNIEGGRIEGAKPDTTRGAGGQNGRFGPIKAQGRILDDGRGRWPANVLHDGSEEVLAVFPETSSGKMRPTHTTAGRSIYGQDKAGGFTTMETYGDSGSAARFFYSPKAAGDERDGNNHSTVKPLALMRYLVRLVTPPGGTVLDHFAGSGSTLIAAKQEGFSFLGCDLEAKHVAIIHARLAKELL